MKLRVSHLTRYEYSHEVEFSPHTLYLKPREQSSLRLLNFTLNVNPNAKVVRTRDAADNPVVLAWFWDRSNVLSIRNEFEVETLESNPFDFIVHHHAFKFPFEYIAEEAFVLSPFMAPPFEDTRRRLTNWLDEHFTERPVETVPFLTALNTLVHQTLTYVRRDERGIQPSVQTLDLATGSCRDYAVLFIEICRTLGLAARFSSGYVYNPPAESGEANAMETSSLTQGGATMHAWAEVYIPGAGWKGLDPTYDMWCADAHIPVAVAAEAETVSPVQGAYYSPNAISSVLHTDVLVERLSD